MSNFMQTLKDLLENMFKALLSSEEDKSDIKFTSTSTNPEIFGD